MKFRVTMKDPDTLHDAIDEALKGLAVDGLDEKELGAVREKRQEQAMNAGRAGITDKGDRYVCTKCTRLLQHSWLKHIGCLIHGHEWHGLRQLRKFWVPTDIGPYSEHRELHGCIKCGATMYRKNEGWSGSGTA